MGLYPGKPLQCVSVSRLLALSRGAAADTRPSSRTHHSLDGYAPIRGPFCERDLRELSNYRLLRLHHYYCPRLREFSARPGGTAKSGGTRKLEPYQEWLWRRVIGRRCGYTLRNDDGERLLVLTVGVLRA